MYLGTPTVLFKKIYWSTVARLGTKFAPTKFSTCMSWRTGSRRFIGLYVLFKSIKFRAGLDILRRSDFRTQGAREVSGYWYGTFGREQIYFFLTQSDQAGSALNAKSSFWAFRNWSDRLLEMKTRKVMSCGVQAGASRAGPLRRAPGAIGSTDRYS